LDRKFEAVIPQLLTTFVRYAQVAGTNHFSCLHVLLSLRISNAVTLQPDFCTTAGNLTRRLMRAISGASAASRGRKSRVITGPPSTLQLSLPSHYFDTLSAAYTAIRKHTAHAD
jgi:hypothetical protein